MSFDDSDEREIDLALRYDMDKFEEDLTLMLVFSNSGRMKPLETRYAEVQFNSEALKRLEDEGYIVKSRREVLLTDAGVKRALRMEAEFLGAMESRYRKKGGDEIIRARESVAFHCEICDEDVKPPLWYEPFTRYLDGQVTREYVIEHMKRYHFRHWHTDDTELYRKRVDYNIGRGMSILDAAEEAREYVKKMVPGSVSDDESSEK
ncbi:MAG: hypothetical protein JRN26_02460 [Nitrososphaerota archaeon]|jgi:hypothetical protein|nr:hypothetical protein [Nitrososphaerota archaeon]MDG6929624.1 hypothetical protein [Nitrososphaerota archaeon]MDG6932395.1 hypothetical protein [Nitrososphaerota archaeon]MDG6935738.1 hypothetical protein [Nitrososphaerota archaeon]MDG6944724.1 hypothetical protein [Nitrososphaerota archaeon]